MEITNTQLRTIIKEELSKAITENEDALKMNKFAKFMAMLELESKQSVFYGLLKQINNGDIGSSKYKLFLKEFKNLILKSYDVNFNGKSSESDLEVVKEIAKLEKKNQKLIDERKAQLQDVDSILDDESEIELVSISEEILPEGITAKQLGGIIKLINN